MRLTEDEIHGRSEYQSARALAFRNRLPAIREWLAANGAILQPNNTKYEVLRYRARASKGAKLKSHIVYRKEDGRLTFTGDSAHHFQMFASKMPFPDQGEGLEPTNPKTVKKRAKKPGKGSANPPSDQPKKSWTKKTREILRERDGCECWYCGGIMFDIPHPAIPGATFDDVTIEHMLARHLGGTNHIDNLVLAHGKCNRDVGHKTVEEKIAVRDYIRAGLKTNVPHWKPTDVQPRQRSRPVQRVAKK